MSSAQHEQIVRDMIKFYSEKGYKTLNLNNKCPDGIAVRVVNGEIEISAIEVLGMQYNSKKGWKAQWTISAKKSIYCMFDKLIVIAFKRGEDSPLKHDEYKIK